jgi:hypothetical protein
LRQGLADFRLVDFALGILERAGSRFIRQLAESEDAGFEGAGAVEAPLVFGDGLGEFLLERDRRYRVLKLPSPLNFPPFGAARS